jgi:hypothetical protein
MSDRGARGPQVSTSRKAAQCFVATLLLPRLKRYRHPRIAGQGRGRWPSVILDS